MQQAVRVHARNTRHPQPSASLFMKHAPRVEHGPPGGLPSALPLSYACGILLVKPDMAYAACTPPCKSLRPFPRFNTRPVSAATLLRVHTPSLRKFGSNGFPPESRAYKASHDPFVRRITPLNCRQVPHPCGGACPRPSKAFGSRTQASRRHRDAFASNICIFDIHSFEQKKGLSEILAACLPSAPTLNFQTDGNLERTPNP